MIHLEAEGTEMAAKRPPLALEPTDGVQVYPFTLELKMSSPISLANI